MKMKFVLIAVLLLLSFVRSDGVIIPHHKEDPYPLILNHYVTVTINDTYAKTRVEQEFRNDGYRDLEGTYMFPVPGGGIRDVKLIVDGQTLEGRLLGSEEAKQTYQQYVLQRKDASLLEYVGRDAFSSSLVLPRGKTVKVVITYEQIIPSSGGLYSYMYPLSPERYSTKPIDPVNITVNINAPGNIGFIYSPTHNITVQRGGKGEAVATYYEEKVLPDKDFQLYYGVSGRDYDVQLLTQKSDDSGYFLLFVYPSLVNQSPIPKDVVFVIDTSGSMEGTKIEQAKNALKYGLGKLNPDDRFNIISFSTVTNRYSNALKGVSSVPDAKSVIDNIFAEGSTDIQTPLVDSISWFQNDNRVHLVVLLTDGRDTTGHSNAEIIKTLKEAAAHKTPADFKLFVFGVGDDVDFELLDKLSNEFGDGIPTYIKSEADLEMTLKSFYDRIATPLLSNVQLTITPSSAPVVCEAGSTACVGVEGAVSTYDLLPRRIPDIFLGTQLVVAGRYSGYGDATVRLKGTINGTEKEITYGVNFPQSSANSFVERTWALRKVGYLLDQIALEGETEELKQQVTGLATKYGIPTPYTSYLVVSNEGNEVRRDLGIGVLPTAGGVVGAASTYKAAENTVQVASYTSGTKVIGDKTFVSVGGIWKDTDCGGNKPTKTISFGSQEYLDLLNNAQLVNYLSVGDSALLCSAGDIIKITPSTSSAGVGETPQQSAVPAASPQPNLSSLAIIPGGVILAFLVLFIALNIIKRYSMQREVEDMDIHRALSSDTRVDILNTLLEGERTPTDISVKLNKSKATIVEHLDKLREADLVEKIEVDGRKWVFYKLTPRGKSIIKKGG